MKIPGKKNFSLFFEKKCFLDPKKFLIFFRKMFSIIKFYQYGALRDNQLN